MAKKKAQEEHFCIGCNQKHRKSQFYVSYNKLHNGVYPYCKKFIKETVANDDGSINIDKLQDILRQIDAPFLIDYWHISVDSGGDIVGQYFKNLKLKQNRDLTWKNSMFAPDDDDEEIDQEEEYDMDITKLSQEKKKKLEDKWGLGYSDTELLLFEKKHKMFRNNYKEKTAMHREALFNYIRYRVKEEMATAEGNVKEAKEWGALASKAATDAKINPSQLSKADLSDGLSTFSELSEAVEKEVDIISILPKFKYRPNDAIDFNIWCYINYMRDLSGLPLCDYEDIYKFYDKRKEDYINQYGDPYGIFEGDTTEKNRDNIKKFIREDDI